MSNRFHSKFHRVNHHTYTSGTNPDAGHDPIASPDQPFRGDFVLNGGLNVYAPLSAAAGYFYSNNTAISAVGNSRGIDVKSGGTGIEVKSTGTYGILLNSSFQGISAYADYQGGSFYSPVYGLNVYGGNTGLSVRSPNYGLNSSGGIYGGNFTGATALFATGSNLGINVTSQQDGVYISSNNISLSTGGNINIFNNRVGIYRTPQASYPLKGASGIVLDVNGSSYLDGNVTITGNLSTLGAISYLDTFVYATSSLEVVNVGGTMPAASFYQYGTQQATLACYDGDISTTVPTFVVINSAIGINVASPTNTFTVNSPVSLNDLTIGAQYAVAINNNTGTNGDLGFGSDATYSYIQSFNSKPLKINGIGSNNIIIGKNGGNVAIGTDTPNYKLSVNGTVSATNFRSNQGIPNNNDSSTVGYSFGLDGDTGLFSPIVNTGANNGVVSIYSNNVEQIRFAGNNLVGIGTSTPNANLTVNGTISSNNLIYGKTVGAQNLTSLANQAANIYSQTNDGTFNLSMFGDGNAKLYTDGSTSLQILTNTVPIYIQANINSNPSIYAMTVNTDNSVVFGGTSTFNKNIAVKEGTNAYMGTATLNGTTGVTVTTTAIAANSRVFLTIQSPTGTVGTPYISSRTAGTSFVIKSTSGTDTSTVAWIIVTPA